MGLRGRALEPTHIKRQKGNTGKRPLNDREPQLGPAVPPTPPGLELDEIAMRQWEELSQVLMSMRC